MNLEIDILKKIISKEYLLDAKSVLLNIIRTSVNTNYFKVVNRLNFIAFIPKNIALDNVVVISSHYDIVYKKMIFKNYFSFLRGTFDNSIGVMSNICLMQMQYKNVIHIFTNREEIDRKGIEDFVNYISKTSIVVSKYLVLDVTTEKVKSSTTIENNNIISIVDNKDIIIIDNDKCGYDESTFLLDKGFLTLSVCCVLKVIDRKLDCHSERGCLIYKSNLKKYVSNIKFVLDKMEVKR